MILAWRASSFGHAHWDPSIHLLDVSTIHRLVVRFPSARASHPRVVHLAYLNDRVNITNELTRQMGWGCNTRIYSIYFSLKCFLQKLLLNLLRTTKQIHRARRVTRDFYSTKKHIRPSDMKVTHNMILGINFNYARSIWIIEIKPAEKDCLATSITGKLWLATNQKQKHDLQL